MPVAEAAPVTVVVTCHNYGRYLAECLDSLLAQTVRPRHIKVYDDASTDETSRVAGWYARCGVEYQRLDCRDVSLVKNRALSEATTPWILFVDADNWLDPRYLEFLCAGHGGDPAVGIVYPTLRLFGARSDVHLAQPFDLDTLRRQNYTDTCSLLRVAAAREVNGYLAARLDPYEDWGLHLRLAARGWKGRPAPRALLHYRTHDANRSGRALPLGQCLLHNSTFTVLTLFCGRRWQLTRYFDWLDRCVCDPERVEIYALDNSDDASFGLELRRALSAQVRFPQVRYERVARPCDPTGALRNAAFAEGDHGIRRQRDAAIHAHLAGLYGYAFARCMGSDFILCVEDDIIPDDDVLPRLLNPMAEAKHFTPPGAEAPYYGACGAVVYSRQFRTVMADYLTPGTEDGSVTLGLPRQYIGDVPAGTVGLKDVDHTCAACTLYRTQAVRAARPRYEELWPDPLFWDVSVSLDLRRAGWKVGLETSCRTRHYEKDGTYV